MKKLPDSPQDALNKFYNKQLTKNVKKKTRKNKKPELEVEKAVTKWLRSNGFSCDVVDASTYDAGSGGKFQDVKITAGFTDIVGADRFGFACYIELKAAGKRSALKDHQREFITAKIHNNAFACVTDGVEHLSDLYNRWLITKLKQKEFVMLKPLTVSQITMDQERAKQILLLDLPKKRKTKSDNQPLF